MFLGILEPKEELKYNTDVDSGDPSISEEKIAVEAAVRDLDQSQVPGTQGTSDINVCVTLVPLGTQPCMGRFRMVEAQAPEKMDFSSLIFGLNGDQVTPTTKDVLGTESLVGPTASDNDKIELFWRVENLQEGEKVEVEPYMLHDCDTVGVHSFTYIVKTRPVGERDPATFDNDDAKTTTVVVELP